MNKLNYLLISFLSFSGALYIISVLLSSADLIELINAMKIIFLPALLCFLFIMLMSLSLYLFFKGKNIGKTKKHTRFK